MKSATILSAFALCGTIVSALPARLPWATALSHTPRAVSKCHIRDCLEKCGNSNVCSTI
ncbi:uncharacterized protein M421DRAFT_423663 [Didymella exigua CBS 183.55]|uniref:Extracellular membrane protein CFEM domain-containing protein n=1 Tax=Didymella exigua CBS 183.55 TaxID=1150837 RepID=A0A6A5RBG2_9PLEO|nr:uncharacterized protein M421DRAFT_423663 [Didymella exigua CBS 183.55]KAF1925571.1 hypothetical protein M421DRAFT_423663 [Didymella exigua CBS 183.55]